MEEEAKSKVTRRDFLKDVGAGAIGTAIISAGLLNPNPVEGAQPPGPRVSIPHGIGDTHKGDIRGHLEELLKATPRYGRRLFRTLFPEGSVTRQALARLPEAPDPAGTVLIVPEDPEAQAIPWEYLHDSNEYLVLKYQDRKSVV